MTDVWTTAEHGLTSPFATEAGEGVDDGAAAERREPASTDWADELEWRGEADDGEYETGPSDELAGEWGLVAEHDGPVELVIRMAIAAGNRDESSLTNLVFFARHPERAGRRLDRSEPDFTVLSNEWLTIRDTIVRPMLRKAGAAATPSHPPPALGAHPLPVVATAMPRSGPGFTTSGTRARYGAPETIAALQAIGAEWGRRHPEVTFMIRDISVLGGGRFGPHKSHRMGLDADVQLWKDGKRICVGSPGYPALRPYVQELVDVMHANKVLPVKTIGFLDPHVTRVAQWPGHSCHLHVRFCMLPGRATALAAARVYGPGETPANYRCPGSGTEAESPLTGSEPGAGPTAETEHDREHELEGAEYELEDETLIAQYGAAPAGEALRDTIGGEFFEDERAIFEASLALSGQLPVAPDLGWLAEGRLDETPGGPSAAEVHREDNRHTRAYAIWVQDSLNRVARAGLAVDGDIGPLTRQAIESFQAAHGLAVDGIVGPRTEAALVAAGATAPPGSAATTPTLTVPTTPTPAGPVGGTGQAPGPATGAAISIPVPVACVQVPALPAPDRPCAGVDSTTFAGLAPVAAFAAQLAECYAHRMAERRQRERHAKAQDEAARRARSTNVPNEGTAARAQRIAAARQAVRPEPIEIVRIDIRGKYLSFLADEFRDTIIGARNRWATRCQLHAIARQWMYGVREQLDFVTLGTGGRSLGTFAPPPTPPGGDQLVEIEPPATASGGAGVQPLMNAFLRELRMRAPTYSAANYPSHGGGAFNARGYSIDLYLRGPTDERGFYERPAAVDFLLAIDAAARAAAVEWRAIYNDYAVAAAINRHLDRQRVIFVGKPRRGGGRIGLNWHGPLILHFHLDITPRSS